MRTIVDLPEHQIKELDALTKELLVSRAELVRRAVSIYLKQASPSERKFEAFGILKSEKIDGLKLQRRLRDEWSE